MIKPFNVLISAGHGGSNIGSEGNDIIEKDYTLDFCSQLVDALRLLDTPDLHIFEARTEDIYVSFKERNRMALDHCCDLIVSVHVEANISPKQHGTDLLYWPGNNYTRKICEFMAGSIPSTLRRLQNVYPADHDWPRANSLLSRFDIDAVLVELGYCSNEMDAQELKEPLIKKQLINMIVSGILEAYRLKNMR